MISSFFVYNRYYVITKLVNFRNCIVWQLPIIIDIDDGRIRVGLVLLFNMKYFL